MSEMNTEYSKNLNYFFNKEYFKGIKENNDSSSKVKYIIDDLNDSYKDEKNKIGLTRTGKNTHLLSLAFSDGTELLFPELNAINICDSISESIDFQYVYFDLMTRYPGLLIGTGNPHALSADNVVKCGFSFDYVTGIPYLPGSSLKGVLRSYFPNAYKEEKGKQYRAYIEEKLSEINVTDSINISELEKEIFDNKDLFIGGYVIPKGNQAFLDNEYITPHSGVFKNPIPINLIKIKPDTRVRFFFGLNKGKQISIAEKAALFKSIILDMGVGAKTNVGFGQFAETPFKTVKDNSRKGDNDKNKIYNVKVCKYNEAKSVVFFKGEINGGVHRSDLKQRVTDAVDTIYKIDQEIRVKYKGTREGKNGSKYNVYMEV